MPSSGVGGNGTASEFGDLTGLTRIEVDEFLLGLGASVKITQGDMWSTNFPIGQK